MSKSIKRVPTVLQMEAVECGAASLTMVLGYFKKFVSLEEVREKCGVNRDGSKASNLLKAARSYGLNAQGYRKDTESVVDLTMPLIIHWNMNHFLVLEGCHNGKYYLNDPAGGRRTVDRDLFNRSFTGIAIAFEKKREFQPSGSRQMTLDHFKKLLNKYKPEIAYTSFLGFMMTLPTLFTAWLAKVFLDEIWLNGRTHWLLGVLLGLLAVAGLRGLSNYIYRILNYRLLEKIRLSENSRLIWKTIHLPANFFMQRYAGDVSARVKNVDNVTAFIAIDLINGFAAWMAIIVFIVALFHYNRLLTFLILTLFIINLVILAWNTKVQEGMNNRISMSNMKLMGASISDIQLIETIKTTSSEQAFFEKWAGYQGKLINEKQEASADIQGLMNLPLLMSMLATVAVLYTGGYLIIHGDLTVGALVAFQSIMASFFASSTTLNEVGMKLPKILADMKRIEDIYYYPDLQSKEASEEVDLDGGVIFEGSLKVENLTFGFTPFEDPLIRDFSLELKPGQRIALVGGSGCGKSTIAKLISGIYKPWSGEIYLDERPVRTLPKSIVNKAIAMVDQEIVLFEGTVGENISLWQQDIDEVKLIQAAKNACIHGDIISRGGYEHRMLEEGQDFSGGQRQRMEIARVLLQDPSVLILDEATSALDPATELEIDKNLRRLGYTCIIVAHRLSTIRDCDEIIVLDKGKIVQRGNHDSLLEQEGLYRELIKAM
ncbi:NHLP family bacteriocin export ABC transporter peptidase/permease/ATPase subunit [Geosporobacter ferrireducens]|nr:NHLP family bacteriocin export ABC transporter peptidase/permease/ATPase subunit [Geosporobacter ferrireducens]MTI54810.1 NHLP family bacteriocin export ABC transporter peptidase/permease/ATPase subunit [Geosporobacter ferrireducens]